LKNQLPVLNQTQKDGYQNGKEKAIKRKAKKEEAIKLKVLVQLEWKKKMFTMHQTVQVPNKLQNNQTKEENDRKNTEKYKLFPKLFFCLTLHVFKAK